MPVQKPAFPGLWHVLVNFRLAFSSNPTDCPGPRMGSCRLRKANNRNTQRCILVICVDVRHVPKSPAVRSLGDFQLGDARI